MTNQNPLDTSNDFSRKAIEAAIKIGMVLLLLTWCFHIANPFINPLAWGMIIAIALYPLYQKMSIKLGGQEKLAAILITVALFILILGPCLYLAEMASENIQALVHKFHDQSFSIPPPNEKIAAWPIIGKPLFQFWEMASTNLETALKTLAPQLKILMERLIASGASAVLAVLQLLASVIICGMLLVNGPAGRNLALSIGKRLVGPQGEELTDLCTATIRGVARGVLGVAVIQTLLASLGFFVADVPGASILTFAFLFIAIVQLPTILLMLPVIVYVFSIHDVFSASLFMAWSLMVGLLDNVLKPILMGRGIDLPMAVIFIGAIGGMVYSGIIGLFVGAVVLALGYKLFLSWLKA